MGHFVVVIEDLPDRDAYELVEEELPEFTRTTKDDRGVEIISLNNMINQ
jgi:hypothetical protein